MHAALFPYVWRHGEQCHGADGCPGESSPAGASWCVLCSYRSGLEGGGVAVGRPAAVVGRFEGAIDGGRTWHSGRRGDVLSPRATTASGCRHSARCGAIVAGMVAQG
jgi:hypothetical protein